MRRSTRRICRPVDLNIATVGAPFRARLCRPAITGRARKGAPTGLFQDVPRVRSGGKNALTVSRGSAYVEWTISEGNSHG